MWQFWLIVAGVCFVIESFTVGFFVFWFGVGALIALAVSFFISNFWIQAIIFVITSTLLLVFTKPLVKKFIKDTDTKPTNYQSVIGLEGIVVEDIDSLNSKGQVKIKGELWSAVADTGIARGTKIKVVSVIGVKVKVEEIHKTANLN